MCSCLGRLRQPQQHQSESWALPIIKIKNLIILSESNLIYINLQSVNEICKCSQNATMCTVYVHLSNGQTADHRTNNATYFHQQSLRETKNVSGTNAAFQIVLLYVFPYLESNHPGNLDSIQITLNLRNTTSCCYWLEKNKDIKTIKHTF